MDPPQTNTRATVAMRSNYPHTPDEMSNYSAHNYTDLMSTPPPTYSEAVGDEPSKSRYSPVQVLPTPDVSTLRRPQTATTAPRLPETHANYDNYGRIGVGNESGSTYVPPMVQQPVAIIHQQVSLPLGPEPKCITCPACHVTGLTRIEYQPTTKTHLMAAFLCVIGMWCCVCLPYCAGSCMNTNHYCGNCDKFLGVYDNGRM